MVFDKPLVKSFSCLKLSRYNVSILKKRQEKKDEDELEKLLSELKKDEEAEARDAAVVSIQIAGLRELVRAIEKLTEAVKKCNEET
ncbi:hypothetical protein P186_1550 [Pyrobaculum ferrireducens]|uniref:Uncharacterized protein n=1 Tax=Pyrobaculum ferrireducens TaxID=1104324 RepID=G7VFG3_9CREN|nr:hypothetical protein P186_1550 [Pyrobaculum ferrireducens]